jgi:hypothetical protein
MTVLFLKMNIHLSNATAAIFKVKAQFSMMGHPLGFDSVHGVAHPPFPLSTRFDSLPGSFRQANVEA